MIKKMGMALVVLASVLYIAYVLTPSEKLFNLIVNLERTIAGFEVQQTQINGFDIEYQRGGEGTTLILLHGLGGNKENWNRIAPYLTGSFDVIALDLPGFGNSSKPIEADYDVSSQVARLKQFVDALQLEHFVLAGNSMGGYVAGHFAAQYPQQVDALWLLNPFGVAGGQTSEMFARVVNGENAMVLPRNAQEFKALFDFLFVEPPYMPRAVIEHLAAQAVKANSINTKVFEQIHYIKNGRVQPELPLEEALSAFNAPVLVMWGDNDRALHVSGAQVLSKQIAKAQVVIMPNIGHLPMIESPKQTAQAFVSFMRL